MAFLNGTDGAGAINWARHRAGRPARQQARDAATAAKNVQRLQLDAERKYEPRIAKNLAKMALRPNDPSFALWKARLDQLTANAERFGVPVDQADVKRLYDAFVADHTDAPKTSTSGGGTSGSGSGSSGSGWGSGAGAGGGSGSTGSTGSTGGGAGSGMLAPDSALSPLFLPPNGGYDPYLLPDEETDEAASDEPAPTAARYLIPLALGAGLLWFLNHHHKRKKHHALRSVPHGS